MIRAKALFPNCLKCIFLQSFMTVKPVFVGDIDCREYQCGFILVWHSFHFKIVKDFSWDVGFVYTASGPIILLTNRYNSAFFTLNSFPYSWQRLLFCSNMKAIAILSALTRKPIIYSPEGVYLWPELTLNRVVFTLQVFLNSPLYVLMINLPWLFFLFLGPTLPIKCNYIYIADDYLSNI